MEFLTAWVDANLLTQANGWIVAVTWAAIEAMTPVINYLMTLKRFEGMRARVEILISRGKPAAGALWCSALVWIPGAQPELCSVAVVDNCQSVFERVAVGIVLGVGLSLSHKFALKTFRGIVGRVRP